MGKRTVVVIDTDTFHIIDEQPNIFVQEINRAMNQTRSNPTVRIDGRSVGRVIECEDASAVNVLLVHDLTGRGYASIGRDVPIEDDVIIKAIAKAHGFQVTLRPTPERIRRMKKPRS